MRLNKTNYIGILILSIPIIIFMYVCFNNKRKEQFSLSSWFTKKKDTNENNIDTPPLNTQINNNQHTMFTKEVSRGPIYNNINNNLTEVKRPKGNLEPVGENLFGNIQCRLLSDCTDDYKYTGAEFNNMKCQNDKSTKTAKAIASIKNGYIENIYLIDGGFGYTKPPKVKIEGGNGSDAFAIAILDMNNKDKKKQGTVIKIEIKNVGRNYNSTPNIIIESPETNHKCKLCCKIN